MGLPFIDPFLIPHAPTYSTSASSSAASAAPGLRPGSCPEPSHFAGSCEVFILLLALGDVLEIVGASCAGKTELLYSAVVQTALPQVISASAAAPPQPSPDSDNALQIYDGVRYGGADSSVLFIDLDYRFTLIRFLQVLEGRVCSALEAHLKTNSTASEKIKSKHT
jgi:hypothetical protein